MLLPLPRLPSQNRHCVDFASFCRGDAVRRFRGRAADLDPFFVSGAIGLTSDGLIEIRDANSVPLADRNRLRKLVSDDNADRNALYREIASANGHPEWEADIRATFADRWVANARAGWYYKSSAGAWKQK